MATLRMTVDEWIAVRDNPRQRDTEGRASRARHLRVLAPDHSHVSMAVVKGAGKFKLDGHTRAFLWKSGKLERPRGGVEVSVYHVGSPEEAAELYTHFDNKQATKSATDDVHGAFHAMGYEPKSGLVRTGRLTSGLRGAFAVAYGKNAKGGTYNHSIFDVINDFAAEILALDDLGCSQGSLTGGEQAAFLLSFRKHADRVLPFWHAYMGNGGTMANGEMDGVVAFRRLIEQRKAAKTLAGGDNQYDVTARGLACVERWLKNETYSVRAGVKAIDVAGYIPKKRTKAA